jgi:hypothetical protein
MPWMPWICASRSFPAMVTIVAAEQRKKESTQVMSVGDLLKAM